MKKFCRLFHRWENREGQFYAMKQDDTPLSGDLVRDMLVDITKCRFERHCLNCPARQYLKGYAKWVYVDEWFEYAMKQARKLGLTKIIPNRENKGTYLERLHLNDRESVFGMFRKNIHCIHMSDDEEDGLHNHPWPYLTIILKGGYWEHLEGGKKKWRKKGDVVFGRANRFHRLELGKKQVMKKYDDCDCLHVAEEEAPCWTMFIMGPRKRRNKGWGFKVDDKFWPHQEWLDKREREAKKFQPETSSKAEMLRSLSVHKTLNEMPFGKTEDGMYPMIYDKANHGYETRVKWIDPNGVRSNACVEIPLIETPHPEPIASFFNGIPFEELHKHYAMTPIKNQKALNAYNNYMKGTKNG